MAIQFHTLSKEPSSLHAAFPKVAAIAHELRTCLDRDEAQLELKARHVFGASSHAIQEVILKDATALGFQSEKKGLFGGYSVAQLRPDYYMAVEDSGILLEVERGKAITNNMDLLDLWKCHICAHASFLFLVVPVERPSENQRKVKAFQDACRRLAPFFEPKNYVNVDAVFLFGY
ncbi:hypothetical protein ACFPN2_14785 [Steroidobacter flavus]|uniref:Uncharacterized protein n=1 Tax=Steroidobacter flavus TaxID=1842136 RepID=A0ABV8SSG4_9GAMM